MVKHTERMTKRKRTNAAFAEMVGCDSSFASLLYNGKRSPGTELFVDIIKVFGLDPAEAVDAFHAGPEPYMRYLRRTAFTVDVPDDGGTGTEDESGTDVPTEPGTS